MIRHIVFFEFKSSVPGEKVASLEKALGELPGLIPEIRGYEFGRDIVRSERSYDFALIATFDEMEGLKRYIKHPDHVKVLKLVNEICGSIRSVDFENHGPK